MGAEVIRTVINHQYEKIIIYYLREYGNEPMIKKILMALDRSGNDQKITAYTLTLAKH